MCEIISIMQSIVIGLLLVTQIYLFKQQRKYKQDTKESIKYTGVPIEAFKDDQLLIFTQNGILKDTKVLVIRVIIRETNKQWVYTYDIEETSHTSYTKVPKVEAIIAVKNAAIKEVIYPSNMTNKPTL